MTVMDGPKIGERWIVDKEEYEYIGVAREWIIGDRYLIFKYLQGEELRYRIISKDDFWATYTTKQRA